MGVSCGQARQHFFVHEGPRRTTTATSFCPRRATKGRGERQRQLQLPFVREGPRRAAKNGNGNTFCPRKATKNGNGNGNTFCPRRAAKDREERQRQLPFVHEGPRRAAENGNGNTFCPRKATKNGNGNGNTFCPRRAAENGNGNTFLSTKGCEERQRQHLFVQEGLRRTATATPFVREGPRRTAKNGNGNFLLSTKGREGPRRTATATSFCPRRAAKGRGERQRQHLLSAKGREGPRRTATATPFVHEGPRRTATATPFVREGPRRAAKNGNGNTFLSTKGCGERQRQHLLSAKGREEHLLGR